MQIYKKLSIMSFSNFLTKNQKWLAILLFMLTSNVFAKGGYWFDLYCKESGNPQAVYTCHPANEEPWEWYGGSYNYQYTTAKYGTMDEVSADMGNYIQNKYGSCKAINVYSRGQAIPQVNNAGLIQNAYEMIISLGFKYGNVCQGLDDTRANVYMQQKRFSCEKGAAGPYKDSDDYRFCAIPLEMCARTPNPIQISSGIKIFPRIYDSPVLESFNLYRSYISIPSETRVGLLNPARTLDNTSTRLMQDNTIGWRLSYEATLSYYRDSGNSRGAYTIDVPGMPPAVFVETSTGFTPLRARTNSFSKNANGEFFYRNESGEFWLFSSSYKLIAVGRSFGRDITLSGTNPIIATNHVGKQIFLYKNSNGNLSKIVLPDGSEIRYTFDDSLRLEKIENYKNSSIIPVNRYYYENEQFPWVITGASDASGQRVSKYEYDSDGRAIQSANFAIPSVNKYTLDFSYGSKVTDPLGTARTYKFSGDVFTGLNIVDSENGLKNSVIPDNKGRPIATYDFEGNQTCSFYDETSNKRVVQLDGLPQYTVCGGYDTVGISLPAGARKISTQWHPDWLLPSRVAEPQKLITYVYNGQSDPFNDNVIASCAPSAAVLPDGKPIVVLCKSVIQDTTDIDGTRGFAATVTGAARVWTYTYDINGKPLTQISPSPGGTTIYSYYNDDTPTHSIGDLKTVVDANGRTTMFTNYTADGHLLQKTDPTGLVTTYAYDTRGRLLVQSVGGLATTVEYSPEGLLSSIKQPSGYVIAYAYDAAQRLTGWSDNRGNSGSYVLDAKGNRISENVQDAGGNMAWLRSRSINAVNRTSGETTGEIQRTSYGYNSNGDVLSQSNGLHQATSFAYDRLRRISTITDALNAPAFLAYNQLGAIAQAKDFKGVTTNYIRDALGSASEEATPDAGIGHATYDARGLLASTTDATGRTIGIERDALGRITKLTYNNGTSSVLRYGLAGATYNTAAAPDASIGHLSEVQDPGVTTQYQRDALGRVLRKTQILASGETRSIAYTYVPPGQGGAGSVQSITYPSGKQLIYQYDGTGRITGMQWNGTALLSGLAWNPLGMPSGWSWPNISSAPGSTAELAEARSYNTAGQLTHTSLLDLTWDAAGRVSGIEQSQMVPGSATGQPAQSARIVSAYSYDAAGRMTASGHSVKSIPAITWPGTEAWATSLLDVTGYTSMGYAYDANGNRLSAFIVKTWASGSSTSTTQTYNIASGTNRLASVSGVNGAASTTKTYQYDAAGAITSATISGTSSASQYLFYGPNGRVAKVAGTASSTDPSAVSYLYNSAGQRILKTDARQSSAAPRTEHTLYSEEDSAQVLGSYQNRRSADSAAPAGEMDSTEVLYLPTASGLLPIAAQINGRLYAIHADHLNTPRRLTNQQGQVVWQWLVTGFGEVNPTTGAGGYLQQGNGYAYSEAVTFNLRYPGQVWDEETQLSYNLNRYYDAQTGRYIQADPIGLDGGWNRFAYVEGNPLNRFDPDGLHWVCIVPFGCTWHPDPPPGNPDLPKPPPVTFPNPFKPIINFINSCFPEESCEEKWNEEHKSCQKWAGFGTRWVRACEDRANKRLGLCRGNSGSMPPDAPEPWRPDSDNWGRR